MTSIVASSSKSPTPSGSNNNDYGDYVIDIEKNGSSRSKVYSDNNGQQVVNTVTTMMMNDCASLSSSLRSFDNKEQGVGSMSDNFHTDFRSLAEEKTVARARYMFLLVLLLAACLLSGIVNWIAKLEDKHDFEAQFHSFATGVIIASNENVRKAFNAIETLSVTITTFVEQQADNGYPSGFITIPNNHYQMKTAKENAGSFAVGFHPIVNKKDYELWNEYSVKNQNWIVEANHARGIDDPKFHDINTTLIVPFIYDLKYYDNNDEEVVVPHDVATCTSKESEQKQTLAEIESSITETRIASLEPEIYDKEYYVPIWQISPPPHPKYGSGLTNFNLAGDPVYAQILEIIDRTKRPTFFDVCDGAKWFSSSSFPEKHIFSLVTSPVFDRHGENATITGVLSAIVTWKVFFENILVAGTEPVLVVMDNQCGDKIFTYHINGEDARFVGDYDAHDPKYDHMKESAQFATFAYSKEYLLEGGNNDKACTYIINVYPTQQFEDDFTSTDPMLFSFVVLIVFLMTSVAFFMFDCLVRRRQQSLATTAARQDALVSSLFPKNVREKLMQEAMGTSNTQKRSTLGKAGLRKFLNDSTTGLLSNYNDSISSLHDDQSRNKSKPIADLFPETTIMFADIAGFTAWSSTREPSQVFTLLESIYREFDIIAKRRGVFKVETIGDCYVAVCGLPDPRMEHAVIMAKFANDCLKVMSQITEHLERELGPDTSDLGLRVGLHSGPVVAGVLRGEKSRFQLFGDTMNTASRMESTGIANRIQISQETANCLSEMGRRYSGWFREREDRIIAKGKGELKTFWLHVGGTGNSENTSSALKAPVVSADNMNDALHAKILDDSQRRYEKQSARVAKWTVEVLSNLLKEIISSRGDLPHGTPRSDEMNHHLTSLEISSIGNHPLDEVEEIICLPEFKSKNIEDDQNNRESDMAVSLSDEVMRELEDFVQMIVMLYNNKNPFHNFNHANHVTMSVVKLLSRIVAPDIDEFSEKTLHDHTYGITSDPLTRFAVVFSALIHDVDHSGVSNDQLVKEKDPIAFMYNNRSVAEQNSVDVAWKLLMQPAYLNLRRVIYVNEAEFKRFRQLVVNTVMATDIMDKELKQLRNKRWDVAFQNHDDNRNGCTDRLSTTRTIDHGKDTPCRDDVNRKATIVIEHLIQASDVAHTMQHWHIYRKWNERFFMECYLAYEGGRLEKDPCEGWYEGEKNFFDYYIIPLAKKLKECGVFGVASDEYLNYAVQNRQEWEERGEKLVEDMMRNVHSRKMGKTMTNKVENSFRQAENIEDVIEDNIDFQVDV